MAADTDLTFDVLESYLNCRYKAHLRLSGFQSTKTDYEAMLIEARQHLRFMAIEKLIGEFGENAISTLKHPLILYDSKSLSDHARLL
jgi:hypothetical protein